MIVNIRGPGGSGKSTLVKQILQHFDEVEEIFREGRRKPLYYICRHRASPRKLCVLGHYEIACGGADTIKTPDEAFSIIREHAEAGLDVVFEGRILNCDSKRTIALSEDLPLSVVVIEEPQEVWEAGMNTRRRAKKPDAEPVDPKNTLQNWKACVCALKHIDRAGIPIFYGGREQSLATVEEILEL